jgi:Tfp pilus assembly protein PilF
VRVFDARLTRVTPLDRDLATSLRRRKARAQEEQLHDAGAALTTLADAFAREPGDFEIRTLFEEKATALAAWDVLADTYEAALARAEGEDRRSLLVAAARVHDERRDDPRKALRAWSTVIEADAEDAQALEEAERLSTLLADWAVHVSVLEKLLKLAGNDDDRRSLALRIGEAKRDMLADPTGAAAAYEMALDLDLDPSSTYLQDACIELWESLGEGQKLLTVLPRRISAIEADDDSEYATTLRRDLSRLNAKLQLSENDDATAAAAILEGLVEAGGDDAETLEELANCYFALQKYEDVERVTLKRIEKLTTADARPARLSLAALRADMLGKPRDAFDGYRDLLNDGAFDDAVAEKLVALAEKNASLAEEAVSLTLSPLEAGTNYALFFRVAKLAERAFGTDDAGQDAHADLALRVAAVHERASDAEAAFDATMAALGRRSALASVRELASVRAAAAGGDALERLADRWLGLATDEMAFETGPVGTETRALLRHLEGEIARDSLSAPERALVAFRAAADLHADGFGSLAALEALHASRNEFAAAAAVAAERAKPEELDADMRAEHLFRAFTHEQNVSAEAAFGRLESVLAARATYLPALAALEAFAANDGGDGKALAARAFAKADRLFADAEDVARRVALHEARLARSLAADEGGVVAALALAEVLADARKDPGAALDVLLARVAAEGALARSGSEVRERILELAVAAERVGATVDLLGVAALAAADGEERREEALALARLVRDRFDDRRRAIAFFEAAGGLAIADDGVLAEQEVLFEALAESAALVATLRARAKLAAEPEALFVRALAVAGTLGDDADAVTEAIAREALERLTDAPFALDALAGVLERKRDFAGLVAVTERRAGVAAEDEKEALLLRAASTALRDVGSSDDAVRLFERAFKELASADAADALLGLYAARNAHRERADLLLVLAGAAHDEARRECLLEAVVTLEALGDSTVEERRALLAQILEDDANHARAEERLDALLVAHAETAAQVSFWEKRAKHHASVGEGGRSAAIAFARRAAAASEETLADTARALASLVIVESCGGADSALLTKIAHLAETTGDRATALRALDALAAEASGTEKSVLCIRLARLHTAAGDVDAAQRSWEAAMAADPEATEPPKALRATYTQQGDRGRLAPLLEAIARLRLRNEPAAGEPHVGGSLLPTAGPAVEVVALFREAATAYGDDHESAARVLEAALAIVPESRDILGELADVELRRGRPEAAATALEKIIASYNGRRSKELAVVHQKLAEAFEAKGDPAGALVQYDASFRIEPGNIRVLRRIGELALESGDLDRAQRSFRALLLQKLDGSTAITKAEVFYFLGEILRRQGDAAKAKEMFQKALQADPAHEPTKAALASLA